MLNHTALYIDGGDPEETKKADELLKAKGLPGLDGQTTNPTLIAKNLAISSNVGRQTSDDKHGGQKISSSAAFEEYKRIVTAIDAITHGPTSIQVIGNPATLTAEEMISQARERLQWIKTAVIKFPCTTAGLTAAETICQEGPVNITLVFSQEQAAAVYAATKYHNYPVYVSPFVGRLDDIHKNGMDVVSNIVQMYSKLGDGHVNVLTASTRTIKHLQYAIWLKSNVMTIPFKLFSEWADQGFSLPADDFIYDVPGLEEIPYSELSLEQDWKSYNLNHELTTAGLDKFWADWSSVVE